MSAKMVNVSLLRRFAGGGERFPADVVAKAPLRKREWYETKTWNRRSKLSFTPEHNDIDL